MFSTNPFSLRPLLDILNKNVEVLENSCKENGTAIPDLNTPFHPSSEAFRNDPNAAEAANIIVAAAHQLAAILTPPPLALNHAVGGFLKSAAIRVCLESDVTEILREAGPQGMHVDDIGKKNGVDSKKLGRFLRILATHHIYKELTPDVFTNTRISSVIDTQKSSETILSDPEHKHDSTTGVAAMVSHLLDETFKAGAYLWDTCSDPKTAHSSEPTATAFARSIGSTETLWQFFARPSEKLRQTRFNLGMRGVAALQSPDTILKAYNWKKLSSGSVVVDVGGGIGSVTHNILKSFPDLRFVVQDLPGAIKEGQKWWQSEMPQAISSGRVVLQVHDFFTPQPQKHATVFMIKHILHDWPDDHCLRILKSLRDAAAPDTALLVLENIIPYACHDPSADDDNASANGIPGAIPQEAPPPLITNYGAVNEMGYLSDMVMCLLFNSQERTVHHFDRLLASAGWKLKVVNRQRGDSAYVQSMEAVPL